MRAIAKFLARNKGFITFMLCMIMFRSAVADWNVVPRNEIIGRSRYMVASLNPDHHDLPRGDRFDAALH